MPRWRCNTIWSKIVPKVILLYIVFTYRLIVIDYAYYCGLKSGSPAKWDHVTPMLAWLFLIHVLFAFVCKSYLHIFLAKERDSIYKGRPALLRLGASLATPPREPPPEVQARRVIFECDAQGEPLRCQRDACNGRWKPPRTRHCGDCRICRPGFDHHCPWFDADITAPETMSSFLTFLALVPILLGLAFAPLYPLIMAHIKTMWAHARASTHVRSAWWSRRVSWLGGPVYRWCVGFILGARELKVSRLGHVSYAVQRRARILEPSITIIVLFVGGLAFTLVAIGLLISTTRQLMRGDLTIDAEIRKRQAASAVKPSQTMSARYFWVPQDEECNGHEDGSANRSIEAPSHRGTVVALPIALNPYAHDDWKENVRSLRRQSPRQSKNSNLPLSTKVLHEIRLRAREQEAKDR